MQILTNEIKYMYGNVKIYVLNDSLTQVLHNKENVMEVVVVEIIFSKYIYIGMYVPCHIHFVQLLFCPSSHRL